jgi:hypothetical protein
VSDEELKSVGESSSPESAVPATAQRFEGGVTVDGNGTRLHPRRRQGLPIRAPTYGNNGFIYKANNSGTTGSTSPRWPMVIGTSTALDGSVTWDCYNIPHAYDIHVIDNKIIGAYGQDIAVVNAMTFDVSRNHCLGRNANRSTAKTFIDCEINTGNADLMQYFRVCDNIIDTRYGYLAAIGSFTMTGISVNGGNGTPGPNYGGGLISNNIIVGNDLGNFADADRTTTGIVTITMSHLTISNNTMWWCYQAGIAVLCDAGISGVEVPVQYVTVTGNRLFDCAGADGTYVIELTGAQNCMVTNNHCLNAGDLVDTVCIIERTAGSVACSSNFYDGNVLVGGPTGTVFQPQSGAVVGRNSINGVWVNGTSLVSLGGGAAATPGTVGGSGPVNAAQYGWEIEYASDGTKQFRPVWR